MFLSFAAVDTVTWVVREIRNRSVRRRLRRRGIEVGDLPGPNAGFSIASRPSAARRHYSRRPQELHSGSDVDWLLVQHREPPP